MPISSSRRRGEVTVRGFRAGATQDLTRTFPGRFSVLLGPNNAGNPLASHVSVSWQCRDRCARAPVPESQLRKPQGVWPADLVVDLVGRCLNRLPLFDALRNASVWIEPRLSRDWQPWSPHRFADQPGRSPRLGREWTKLRGSSVVSEGRSLHCHPEWRVRPRQLPAAMQQWHIRPGASEMAGSVFGPVRPR